MISEIIRKIKRLFSRKVTYWFPSDDEIHFITDPEYIIDCMRLISKAAHPSKFVLLDKIHPRFKVTSKKLIGLCPFHKERTPSFSVTFNSILKEGSWGYYRDGGYHCFSCSASGNVSDLIEIHGIVPFFEKS